MLVRSGWAGLRQDQAGKPWQRLQMGAGFRENSVYYLCSLTASNGCGDSLVSCVNGTQDKSHCFSVVLMVPSLTVRTHCLCL